MVEYAEYPKYVINKDTKKGQTVNDAKEEEEVTGKKPGKKNEKDKPEGWTA